MITKAQFEALAPYEKHIINAYKNSFVHVSGADFIKIAQIYQDITGKALTKSQMNCNTCRLNTLKKLGKEYLDYQEYLKQQSEETIEEKPKTNRGRKKKLPTEE